MRGIEKKSREQHEGEKITIIGDDKKDKRQQRRREYEVM